MQKTLIFFILITCLLSCSSRKDIVQGYSGEMLAKARRLVPGKSPEAVRKLLGAPALEGECKTCIKGGLYRMIYLEKDMRRFYLNLFLNTDEKFSCHVLDFNRDTKTKGFLFDQKKGIKTHKNCNEKSGPILSLQEKLDAQLVSQ